ncbi:hypothetical protein STEG23_033627, partial [Scotinomys teguina]
IGPFYECYVSLSSAKLHISLHTAKLRITHHASCSWYLNPGILMQREDVILEWIFLPHKPNKKLKTYIEKISDLIHKVHNTSISTTSFQAKLRESLRTSLPLDPLSYLPWELEDTRASSEQTKQLQTQITKQHKSRTKNLNIHASMDSSGSNISSIINIRARISTSLRTGIIGKIFTTLDAKCVI